MGWGGSSLCSQPEDPHQGTLPAPPMDSTQSPALRGAPTAHLGWRTPTWEGRGGGKGHPPSSPSLFANQDTDSLFNFTMEGWDERNLGGGGVILFSPPPSLPWLCRSRAKPLPCTLCFRLLFYIIYFPLLFLFYFWGVGGVVVVCCCCWFRSVDLFRGIFRHISYTS